ncbi:hypothetical protein CERZMDRAFT_82148 [Cercospora zeae-maydis SCOH1-5]|uniref:non-specific serine/threonine protein kinase n=1 Tax=Cercospora zeae-maydis SCOH1-5 TaxID=717836 RepID=A0A6A6FSG6_9PEZI|nr:hypothetical protein CERZMDRAFT_82148 [Cercospora zeae-maydis SCOH1-5]
MPRKFERLRSRGPPLLPEPFIWSLVESLATAGLLMERGELESNGILPWDTIIHRDLKPGNLFVSDPSTGRYRGYPQIKVGDFGFALLESQTTREKPRTSMLMALQVYAVGAVLWEVLTGLPLPSPSDDETGISLPIDLDNPEYVRQMQAEPPALGATAFSFYSRDLRELTYAMMRHDATARPSFSKILKKSRKFADSPRNPAQGLRDAPPDDSRYKREFRLIIPGMYQDEYAVGMPLDELDRGAYEGAEDFPPSLPNSGDEDSDWTDDLGGKPGAPLLSPDEPLITEAPLSSPTWDDDEYEPSDELLQY